MAIVNLKIKSLLKKRRSNQQKAARQATGSSQHKHGTKRTAKPKWVDTTPVWVDTPALTVLPEGAYMSGSSSVPEPTTVSVSRTSPSASTSAPQRAKVTYTTPTRQLEAAADVDYDEARRRLGDVYLAATQGFGSDFIRPPKYPKRK